MECHAGWKLLFLYISLRYHLQRQPMWPVGQSQHHPVPCSLTWQAESIWCCHVYTAIYNKAALLPGPSLNLAMDLTILNVTFSCGPNMAFSNIMVSRHHTNLAWKHYLLYLNYCYADKSPCPPLPTISCSLFTLALSSQMYSVAHFYIMLCHYGLFWSVELWYDFSWHLSHIQVYLSTFTWNAV